MSPRSPHLKFKNYNMGSCQTKEKSSRASERVVEGLKSKVRVLQGEINEMMCMRERESQVYERELMVLALRQAEWRRERKRLKDELRRLGRVVEEKEERLRCMEGCCVLEEQARRDETLEKWKQLYFAIKVELDDLISRTHQDEEEMVMKELQAKEERIELLQAKLASMEDQEFKREREVDILRQSLRIMSHKKRGTKPGKRSIQEF
ncbi:histone-lysine N-methyltransferase, H3 lysine-79 specific-like isoform X2 [Sesamum indicum]|uniref:Histone-lysine N-methyltransferase, H3 lysine-79 specific-like isoform X2 n=1 Tax=Sesamum indicum TaxID=4182 RepID=A0A8M8UWX5_SESIN|nr:histone-lysine N-methyltransferase, H3 lysine-79 specific-like isoform X2 [Sesamum indicum]